MYIKQLPNGFCSYFDFCNLMKTSIPINRLFQTLVGHAVCAQRAKVEVKGFGVFLSFMYPGAYVDFDHDHLVYLPPFEQLRVSFLFLPNSHFLSRTMSYFFVSSRSTVLERGIILFLLFCFFWCCTLI